MCFGKPLTKVFVWLLLLLHVFVAYEMVKMGLTPGNLGQRSENKLLEKQHPATPHFHTYEKKLNKNIFLLL